MDTQDNSRLKNNVESSLIFTGKNDRKMPVFSVQFGSLTVYIKEFFYLIKSPTKCKIYPFFISSVTKNGSIHMTSQPQRRAKTYDDDQQKEILDYLKTGTRYPVRNKVIFLLSTRVGLRAGEIAQLCWHHVLNYKGKVGDVIRVSNEIAKGKGGREIDMPKDLVQALVKLYVKMGKPDSSQRICLNHHKKPMTPNAIAHKFYYWFKMRLHWDGYSSHSGRRTFITKVARKISLCGGSIYDVCLMAGHADLATTQKYIEGNREAQKKAVNMI